MKLITLKEFQKHIEISDSALIWLLKENKIPCQTNDNKGLVIDIDRVDTKALIEGIATIKKSYLESEEDVLVEKFARIIDESLQEFLNSTGPK